MFVETKMKGWEVYTKDWGCGDWRVMEESIDYCDRSHLNVAITWAYEPPSGINCALFYFRQLTPVQVRLLFQVNLRV